MPVYNWVFKTSNVPETTEAVAKPGHPKEKAQEEKKGNRKIRYSQ
jgi:hypothetical protein